MTKNSWVKLPNIEMVFTLLITFQKTCLATSLLYSKCFSVVNVDNLRISTCLNLSCCIRRGIILWRKTWVILKFWEVSKRLKLYFLIWFKMIAKNLMMLEIYWCSSQRFMLIAMMKRKIIKNSHSKSFSKKQFPWSKKQQLFL